MNILILYSSTDGHTKKISEFIHDILCKRNNVQISNINNFVQSDSNLSKYDFVLIGASIRYGTYRKDFLKFLNRNYKELNKIKSAFFSVNIVARKKDKNTVHNNPYIKKFYKLSKWQPSFIDVFAGKLDYPNYNFINKNVIRFIMYITKGPTKTNEIIEFTNWKNVRNFAMKIINYWILTLIKINSNSKY